ncbi:hypothetical protein SUGI_0295600 [Cryptomeria japonica]|uniref:uncharacterized protein LOC131058342 n=1 Tax=Cryptomeria japonica TaxID=3369 RepID=UPI002408D036|nr:uncharacterized protein LOC131058342 [Cryptomeria japonica]GLJ17090.1 hypothetical protein SUGI_0295600 [Cryptomeria japonica]
MAESRLRFGTQSSADVKLFLSGPGDEKYGRNPVYLHSQILKRLKCFQSRFSNRWSSDKSTEMRVTTSHNFDHYLKCIEIMYGEHVDFLSIKECLAILLVASEMSADECINKCMRYLEAVRWSAEEKMQILKVLSCEGLKLKILPDLDARLHWDNDDDHINFVEKIIQEMVSLIKCSGLSSYRNLETVEKDLRGMLEGNTSRDVVEVCGRVLLQEFKASVDSRDFSTLTLLFNLIQHCDGGILEAALKAFCEDVEFMKDANNLPCTEAVFDIIMWFMKATGDGKIIISRASRVSFLTTWLPIIGTFNYNRPFRNHISPIKKLKEFDKAVLSVVLSLPQVDQKRICVLLVEVYKLNRIDMAMPFALSKFLLKCAHSKSTAM